MSAPDSNFESGALQEGLTHNDLKTGGCRRHATGRQVAGFNLEAITRISSGLPMLPVIANRWSRFGPRNRLIWGLYLQFQVQKKSQSWFLQNPLELVA
jgi:hypothetical protein